MLLNVCTLLGNAPSEDTLLLSPCDVQMRSHTNVTVFEPRFTYHGFRYASMSQLWWLSAEQLCMQVSAGGIVEARVLTSDLIEGGHVTMDSDEWAAIERACVWSSRSNLMGIPTDCPQRDVRAE
jgi:alpha-L-rhamnosidase